MNIVAFVVGSVLFVGGIVLFGYAWDGSHFSMVMFGAGVLTVSASIAIPFHILKRIDG
ncbi:MAG: hypothetical protein H7146_10985 [Burkholderiaceae bacterium]|nr:hypothetical protein [Microbacteriaceae bacterium]